MLSNKELMQQDNKKLQEHVDLIDKRRLRRALNEARDQLLWQIGWLPRWGEDWRLFIEKLTPDAKIKSKATDDMLELMCTGLCKHNKIERNPDDNMFNVAIAVTRVQNKRDTWLAIYKYAYGKDAEELVLDGDMI